MRSPPRLPAAAPRLFSESVGAPRSTIFRVDHKPALEMVGGVGELRQQDGRHAAVATESPFGGACVAFIQLARGDRNEPRQLLASLKLDFNVDRGDRSTGPAGSRSKWERSGYLMGWQNVRQR